MKSLNALMRWLKPIESKKGLSSAMLLKRTKLQAAETKQSRCMKSIFKLVIILCLMVIGEPVSAQLKGHERKAINKDLKIALNDILGDWYATDSTAYKISFININNFYVDIIGIKHGVGNYSFRVIDDSIAVNGSAANWPPYDCTLRLVNKKHLEIEFYQFLSTETTKLMYRR
jgi:hypothetical protein